MGFANVEKWTSLLLCLLLQAGVGKNRHEYWQTVGYATALSNACKSCRNIFLKHQCFEVAESCLALRFPKWCWNNQSSQFVGCAAQGGKMIAVKAGTTGTEISVHNWTVIQAKKERAGGIFSNASDLWLAGFSSANPAASRSPPLPDKAFCSKGL